MEYGKLAYLKAEELEQRLSKINTDYNSYNSHLSVSLSGVGGLVPLATIEGSGSIGIVAKVTALNSVGKSVAILAGDAIVGDAVISDLNEAVIIGSVVIEDSEVISLDCGSDTAVTKVEVMFCGSATVKNRAVEVRIASNSDKAAIITSFGGRVKLTIAEKEDLDRGVDPANGMTIGFGNCCGIAPDEDGFVAVWADGKSIFISEISFDGTLGKSAVFDCDGAVSDVAVWRGKDGYLIVYIARGEIFFRRQESDFKSVGREEQTSVKADKVQLVGKNEPYLIYSSNRKCFLTQFQEGVSIKAKIGVTSTFKLGEG